MRYQAMREWPYVSTDASDIPRLFSGPDAIKFQNSLKVMLQRDSAPICSLDLEFNPERPTVLGLSDGVLHISVPWDSGRPYLIELLHVHPDIYWIGHFLISADVQVLAKEGIALRRQNVTDSVIWHTLTAGHLNKGTGKTEDGHDKRGKGYMNLWTYASLHTSYRNWKECIGEENGCDGVRPCPDHNEFAYNACFISGTAVWMADGTWKPIQKIQPGEKVKSFLNGNVIERPVIRRTSQKDITKHWVSVKVDGEQWARKNSNGVVCTNDHLWLTPGGWKKAENLSVGDEIYLPRTGHPDVIFGSLLGDGCIYKEDQFAVAHSNKEWAQAKSLALGSGLDTNIHRGKGSYSNNPMYRTEKKTASYWRKKFYADKQKIWNPPLSTKALAIFYGDDGCIQRVSRTKRDGSKHYYHSCAKIALHKFMPQLEEIKQWFLGRYGKCSIGNKAVLSLSSTATKIFWQEIAPFLHPSAQYKMDPAYRGKYNGWMETECNLAQIGRVLSVNPFTPSDSYEPYEKITQYCLEVADTHCFFTKGGLVKNCDAAAVIVGLPNVVRKARLWRVAHLHDLHRDLLWSFQEMSNYGVMVDMPYVDKLRQELLEDKARIAAQLPFNPASPLQVVQHFKKKGIVLTDAQEETIRKAVEGGENDPELEGTLEYKELGNGPDRWYKRQYRDKNGWWKGFVDAYDRIHCRLGIFTSSFRLNSADPNMNNIGKRRVNRYVCTCTHGVAEHRVKIVDGKEKKICTHLDCLCVSFKPLNVGKKLRRAIIASPGTVFVDADWKNGENMVYMYLAGENIDTTEDFHSWMAANIGIDDSHPFAMKEGSARDAAKTVVHATDYGEGIKLMTDAELRTAKIKKEIDLGARIVFPEWKVWGQTVTFTGINLARRALGKASLENRKATLDIAARYLDRFPGIRKLQMRITAQLEREGGARPPHGYFTRLTGNDEDAIKSALAIWGSQPISHLLKLSINDLQRRFERGETRLRPLLPIHDELLCEWPADADPVEGCRLLKDVMERETPEMPGMRIKAEPSYGVTWRDLQKVKI